MVKLMLLLLIAAPVYGQTANKVRVLSAPGTNNSSPTSWANSLSAENNTIDLVCSACAPNQKVSVSPTNVDSISYGEAAYHHWKAGLATSVLTLGGGAIVGLWPHHRHYFTITLKDKTAISLEAAKHDYRQIASMLNAVTGQPIEVTQKDANSLQGVPVRVTIQK